MGRPVKMPHAEREERRQRVLDLAADGYSITEICSLVGISRTHVKYIRRGIRGRRKKLSPVSTPIHRIAPLTAHLTQDNDGARWGLRENETRVSP